MSILEKLGDLDRRIILLGMFICAFVPVLTPLNLPVPLLQPTLDCYNAVDSLETGDILLMNLDHYGAFSAELLSANVAIMYHARIKGVKVVGWATSAAASDTATIAFEKAGFGEMEYGVDYVDFGYVPGGEPSMAQMARSVSSLLSTDKYGNSFDDLPLMSEWDSFDDIQIEVFTTAGMPDKYIRQFTGHDCITFGIVQSIYFSNMYQYIAAGQIPGFINGLRGTAEYENLVGIEGGGGGIAMDQASITHLYAVFLLIIGNVGYIYTKFGKGE